MKRTMKDEVYIRESELMSKEAYRLFCNTDNIAIYKGSDADHYTIKWEENRYEELTEDEVRAWFDEFLDDYNHEEAEDIARAIRKSDTWDPDDCEELCRLAGMLDEWKAADGETFERVLFAAAEKLNVEIVPA